MWKVSCIKFDNYRSQKIWAILKKKKNWPNEILIFRTFRFGNTHFYFFEPEQKISLKENKVTNKKKPMKIKEGGSV